MNRNTIKLVRLKSGETLICGYTSLPEENKIRIERPMQISSSVVMGKKGGVKGVNLYLRDWMEYSKDSLFELPTDTVMLIADPDSEIVMDYHDAIEQNDLYKIQQEFENVAKNYIGEKDDEDDDKPSTIEYNTNTSDDFYNNNKPPQKDLYNEEDTDDEDDDEDEDDNTHFK